MPAAPGSLGRKIKREERTDGDSSHHQSSSKKPFSSRSGSSRSAARDDGDGGGRSAARDDDADGGDGGGGGETVSMSVAETNKIRASLGLAPLDETPADGGEEKFTDTGERIMKDTDTNSEFVHKPADSWTSKKEQEKLREKLEAAKNKREALDKLSSVRTLSTPANEAEDDAAQWVNMMRSKEEQKRQAEQRVRYSLFRLPHLFQLLSGEDARHNGRRVWCKQSDCGRETQSASCASAEKRTEERREQVVVTGRHAS